MPLKRRRAISAGCVLAALALPAPVQAASSGVHVDPNSPPGKEYAIPLATARGQGSTAAPAAAVRAGSAASGQAGGTPAASQSGLFGAGITRSPPARPAPRRHTSTARTLAATSLAPTTSIRRISGTGGGSTATFWVGAALALLIPGLAVGFGVRRWRHA